MKRRIVTVALVLGLASVSGAVTASAACAAGWQQNAEQKWEYYDENEKLVKSQWIEEEGKYYYVDGNGVMVRNTSVAVDKVYYAFGEDGHLLTGGWVSVTEPPKDEKSQPKVTWYYAGQDGALLSDGWHEVNGHQFYFNKNGSCTREGVVTVGKDKFYVTKDQGRIGNTPGWFKAETQNSAGATVVDWYYAKEDGSLYYNSWLEEGGSWYYLQSNGKRAHNGSTAIEGSYYAFDGEGRLLTGGWVTTQAVRTDPTKKANPVWYYASEDGKLLTDGWHTVDGEELYFAKNGACTRNGAVKVGDDKFYVEEGQGRKGTEKGWFSVDVTAANGTVTTYWYYAKEDGSICYGDWFEIDGHKVYFDSNGRGQFNKWFKIGEENVCVNKDGDRLGPGWVSLDLVNSKGEPYTNWYYINEDMTRTENGFSKIDGSWYYFDKNGVNYRKKWFADPETKDRYYLEEDGVMKENGWFSIDTVSKNKAGEDVTTTRWYYAEPNGSCLKSGDHEVEGKIYYFSDAGVNLRKAFRKEGNRRKYYGEDGAQKRGEWFSITSTSTITGPATMEMELEDITTENETWYYADEEGWVQGRSHSTEIDGNEYKFNKSGVMVTDWQKDDQGDYTFYGKDGAKASGWVEYEMPASWLATEAYNNYATLYGKKAWFYLDPGNGGKAVRAQNQSYSEVQIEGHYYAVNARGMVWLGWCKTQRNKKDDMRRYHYYAPQAESGMLQGERAANCGLLIAPPPEMSLGTDPTWYYFDHQGDIIHSSEAGDVEIVHLGNQEYVLVDFNGMTKSGLAFKGTDKVRVRDVYYFDPENRNLRASGTKEVTLPDGRKEWYAFGTDGIGITGEVGGYLYYKGRLQTGDGTRVVSVVKNEGNERTADVINRYLVDASGKVIKNADNVEGLGGTFSSNASGVATAINGTSEAAVGPADADFTAYIGSNEKD